MGIINEFKDLDISYKGFGITFILTLPIWYVVVVYLGTDKLLSKGDVFIYALALSLNIVHVIASIAINACFELFIYFKKLIIAIEPKIASNEVVDLQEIMTKIKKEKLNPEKTFYHITISFYSIMTLCSAIFIAIINDYSLLRIIRFNFLVLILLTCTVLFFLFMANIKFDKLEKKVKKII